MDKNKLEKLAAYAVHDLKIVDSANVLMDLEGFDLMHPEGRVIIAERTSWTLDQVRPALIPLYKYVEFPDLMEEFSDYSEESFQASFLASWGRNMPPVRSLNCMDHINATIFQLMLKHNLDVFGLIDQNLAVDITKVQL